MVGAVLRQSRPLFPEIAIRELIANVLIHQDMTIQGAEPQIELFQDRIEITNPGHPLVQLEHMIDLSPGSRNEMLASLMRRMRLCEEQGGGLDKVVVSVEVYQLPPLKIQSKANSTQIILYGPRAFSENEPTGAYPHLLSACGAEMVERGKDEKLNALREIRDRQENAAQASQVISSTSSLLGLLR